MSVGLTTKPLVYSSEPTSGGRQLGSAMHRHLLSEPCNPRLRPISQRGNYAQRHKQWTSKSVQPQLRPTGCRDMAWTRATLPSPLAAPVRALGSNDNVLE